MKSPHQKACFFAEAFGKGREYAASRAGHGLFVPGAERVGMTGSVNKRNGPEGGEDNFVVSPFRWKKKSFSFFLPVGCNENSFCEGICSAQRSSKRTKFALLFCAGGKAYRHVWKCERTERLRQFEGCKFFHQSDAVRFAVLRCERKAAKTNKVRFDSLLPKKAVAA